MKRLFMLAAALGAISAAVAIARVRRNRRQIAADWDPWPDDYLEAEIIVGDFDIAVDAQPVHEFASRVK